jgi:hypothetical protein
MAKAIASSGGGLLYRFLSNEFFVRYQKELSVRPYTTPDRHSMVSEIMPGLHHHLLEQKRGERETAGKLTVMLDGWTTVSKSSIYAYISPLF